MSADITAGSMRKAADWQTCAAEPCDQDATMEVFHSPSEERLWVPLCAGHLAAIERGEGLEYLVESHGFVPAWTEETP